MIHAIGSGLPELARADARFPRALARLALRGAVHPRRTLEPTEDAASFQAHRRSIAEAIDAEKSWLDGRDPEPPWPTLAPWHSRRRRGIQLGPRFVDEEPKQPATTPEMYVDEHVLSILVNYLIALMIGEVPAWVVSLLGHLMEWAIEANNGPPGDDEHERDNRPIYWNLSYFDVLGILCVTLPFETARALFIDPIMTLHEEALLDAMGAFLRGFDRATIATDMPQPENPVGVRSLFAERLQRGRRMRDLNYRASFSAETHLGDALHAMFYQPSQFMRARRAHILERWDGVLQTMPVLTPLVTSASQSGYLAVVFLTLMESYPSAALLPAMTEVTSATNFWNEHQVGHRICEWIDRALSDGDDDANVLAHVRDDLGRCLDVLVRSGIASGRPLEARIAADGPLKKTS